jgi:hypothetical protein
VRDDSHSHWKPYLGLSLLAGLLALALHAWGGGAADAPRQFGAAFFLAGACFFVGLLIGFIFGIPRTGAADPGQAAGSSAAGRPSYVPNTNLEDVSDWLTKLLIGVGLVQLSSAPRHLRRFAEAWRASTGHALSAADAAAVIVFFFCVGLLTGYLWTRLALIGDFIAHDPRRRIDELIDAMGRRAMDDPSTGRRPADRQALNAAELRTAEAIARISLTSKLSSADLQQQIALLAARYDALRAALPSGLERTRELEIVATQLRGFALAAGELLPGYAQSASAGERLAALVFLQVRPDPRYLPWLAERFSLEVPFLQYHAALAMRSALQQWPVAGTGGTGGSGVRSVPADVIRHYQAALDNAEQAVRQHHGNPEADELLILRDCLQQLGQNLGQHLGDSPRSSLPLG